MDTGEQEWRDSVLISYGTKPIELPQNCDGCGDGFSISHTLDCKKDVLTMSCHNYLCDRVSNLDRKDITPTHVHNDLLINPCRAVWSGKAFLAK